MNKLPCIVCENGDPYSNIVCDDCEYHQDWLEELNKNMERLVCINNDISGYVPVNLLAKVRYEVSKIWYQLNDIIIQKETV
jgi:hypothetical protein